MATQGKAQDRKPNILVIWGDDVGMWNISAYHRGMMGGSTPNIDRIAKEGMLFVDHYGQASCTAGRAAFITGVGALADYLAAPKRIDRGEWPPGRPTLAPELLDRDRSGRLGSLGGHAVGRLKIWCTPAAGGSDSISTSTARSSIGGPVAA